MFVRRDPSFRPVVWFFVGAIALTAFMVGVGDRYVSVTSGQPPMPLRVAVVKPTFTVTQYAASSGAGPRGFYSFSAK